MAMDNLTLNVSGNCSTYHLAGKSKASIKSGVAAAQMIRQANGRPHP
jgi:hypothetical protein